MSLRHTQRQRILAAAAIPAGVWLAGCGATDQVAPTAARSPQAALSPAALHDRPGGSAARVVAETSRGADGAVLVHAAVKRPRARTVAVSFFAGDRALGTDTTAPYRLDVAPGDLAGGRHPVRAVAVDRLGRRTTSRGVAVGRVAGAAGAAALHATPTSGLPRALAALRAGHVTVRLAPGRYAMPAVRLGPGARLLGSGRRTVLTPAPGDDPWALLNAQGRHIRIADLAVDGDGRAGRAVSVADGSADVRVQRVSVRRVQVNAVEAWGAHRDVSVQDSVLDGRGASNAGVFDLGSDGSRDVSVVRTRIFGFRAYGVVFAQRFYGRPRVALHNLALDDDISDITDPAQSDGRSEGGIWSGGVAAAIVGNRVRRTGTDGIQTVGSSRGTTIAANDVARTPVGIYLEHSTEASLVTRNRIGDVGTAINVEWRHAGGGSRANAFTANTVVRASRTGVFLDVGSDANRVDGNRFLHGARPAIVLQGSSANVVRGNRGCGGRGRMVVEQAGRREDGALAQARANRLADNVEASSCAG
jgi:parallel beta-helix repeat protein